MTAISPELVDAYRATHFRVLEEKPFILKVGETSADLLALHRSFGVDCSAFLTAYNPFSQMLSEADNLSRQTRLRSMLAEVQVAVLEGVGVDPSGEWPGEPSLLALGLSRAEAIELGNLFDQNAVVWIGADGVPELVLLR